MRLTRYTFAFMLVSFISVQAAISDNSIDPDLAASFFREAQEQCAQDNGHLWGQSLCVPMAFIHPETRQFVANQQDSAETLTKQGDVYIGSWPANFPVANSTWSYNGVKWTTLVWPPADNKTTRKALMLHESFHNIQEELGFPATSPKNPHLSTRDGRIWLRVEWAALKAALKRPGHDRQARIYDALVFRAYRRSLFPGSRETENQFELHEGVAEYTGMRLCGLPLSEAQLFLADSVFKWQMDVPSFESSFAYVSGPAYGLLLDELNPNWRKELKPESDFGFLLLSASNITLPENLEGAAGERMADYDGEAVRTEETNRELEHLRKIIDYQARLVDGPVLIIPLQEMNIQYDPRGIMSLHDLGTIYPVIRVSDVWGILTVTGNGALMAPNWNQITIPAPDEFESNPVTGNGWTLELNEGWKVITAKRVGDYTLDKSD